MKICSFEGFTKTKRFLVLSTKEELEDKLKEYKQKGRGVQLGKACSWDRCIKFNEKCVLCIKDYYGIHLNGGKEE